MRLLQKFLLVPLILSLLLPINAAAQVRHAVSPSDLAGAVSAHADRDVEDRAVVLAAIARPEVREVAQGLGIDAATLERSVGLLNGDDLSRAADSARQVNDALVGGQSRVVISTTTIIIILLLVIIIVAVAD